jgi:hypothetical protein
MKAFAIHSADGDLVALVTCQPDDISWKRRFGPNDIRAPEHAGSK